MKQPFLTLFALSLLLLAGAFFLPDQPPPATASSHTDLDRLRDIYRKTGGHTHWAPHCREQWFMPFDDETRIVTLGAGRVIALRLAGCGLIGPIPGSMMELTRLQVLDLADNNLSGPIPKEIGNLSDLVQLDLANNRLDGAIPPHIGNIPNLQILNLENNQLSGELPPQLNNLVNLTELRLIRNRLHGEIPHSFDNLGLKIETLRLQETSPSLRTNRLWGCLKMSPGDPYTGVPYCQEGRIPPPKPTPRPTPTRVRFPTPTYTPVPTFTPVPTYTPRPTFTPAATWTPVPTLTPTPTPTPVVNPKVNFTAVRKEIPFGEPIKLTLTLTGHPREWRSLHLTLNAPDGVTLPGSDANFVNQKARLACTLNVCDYSAEFNRGDPSHTIEIEASASAPGELTFRGTAFWFHSKSEDSAPFDQSFATTVTVLPPKAPFVDLHASKTLVKVGEPVVLTLTAQNFNARQFMTLNLSLPVPDGWSIQQTDFARACSGGQCFYKKELGHSDRPTYIGITVVPNEPGEVDDIAKIEWFYGDGLNDGEKEVPLKLTVDPAVPTPSPIPTPPPAGTTEPISPPPTLAATPTPIPAPTAAAAPTAPPTVAPIRPANSGQNSPGNSGGDELWITVLAIVVVIFALLALVALLILPPLVFIRWLRRRRSRES